MKYYIIAGEASGDLHGSNLIKEIKQLDTSAEFRAWGGGKMEAAGATLAKHYKDLAFMGFAEVVSNLPAIFRNFSYCKADITQYHPDVVVLLNYSAFNLRMAKWTRQHHFRNIFYISPQVWAWKESRVKTIKKYVDKMIVILPFEKPFFKKWDYDVDYVGHPLVSVIEKFRKDHVSIIPSSPTIALLPGSRRQEIQSQLPVMLKASEQFPAFNFIVARAPSIEQEFYEPFLAGYANVKALSNKTYSLLMQSQAAVVTSGTATLETALFGVPEIVCYKASNVSYQIARRLVKLKYICLVNLIMDKEVVKELIQNQLTPENISEELRKLLFDPQKKQELENDYAALKKLLSEGGDASANAAKLIYDTTRSASPSMSPRHQHPGNSAPGRKEINAKK